MFNVQLALPISRQAGVGSLQHVLSLDLQLIVVNMEASKYFLITTTRSVVVFHQQYVMVSTSAITIGTSILHIFTDWTPHYLWIWRLEWSSGDWRDIDYLETSCRGEYHDILLQCDSIYLVLKWNSTSLHNIDFHIPITKIWYHTLPIRQHEHITKMGQYYILANDWYLLWKWNRT
jgi:hypothetical protein